MAQNEYNQDSGYVEIAVKDDINCKEINLNNKLINSQLIDTNNESIKKYYNFIEDNEEKGYLCDYKDCEHFDPNEKDIISHVMKHLAEEQCVKNHKDSEDIESSEKSKRKQSTREECVKMSEKASHSSAGNSREANGSRISDRIKNKPDLYVCDRKGCEKHFSNKNAFDDHISDHLVQEFLEGDRYVLQTYGINDLSSEVMQQYLEVIEMNGKTQYICKECDLKLDSLNAMSRHIHTEHLSNKSWNQSYFDNTLTVDELQAIDIDKSSQQSFANPEQIHSSVAHLNGSILSQALEGFPMTSTPIDIREQLNGGIKTEFKCNNNVNISVNKDVLLSCKGLQATKNVQQYIELQTIDGEKAYVCKKCKKVYKRSQRVAEHINLIHFGIQFKCNKPNCFKVFKNPHAWREHQKNHICGFGIYGYGRNVIGVCRNENINQYREKVIINGMRSYRCKWDGCNAVSKYFTAMKRHIHNQHICPHRINLHAINRMNNIMKTPSTSANTSVNSKKFNCNECNERFKTESDLLKHQSICKTVNIPNSYQILNQFISNPFFNSHAINNVFNTQNLDNNESEEVNQIPYSNNMNFISQTFGGVEYHLCKYSDCKFTTKFLNKIIEHIMLKHLGNNSQLNNTYDETDSQTTELDYKQSSSVSSIDNCDKTSKKFKSGIEVIEINNANVGKEVPINANNAQNHNNVYQYMEKKCTNGETIFYCKWNECKQFETTSNAMVKHIKEAHIRFECDIENCTKSFHSQEMLRIHKNNHICGFGIKGRKSVGVCDLDNVRKYRSEKQVEDKTFYSCKWSGCPFESESKNIALSHIHNRHICPNRFANKSTKQVTNAN